MEEIRNTPQKKFLLAINTEGNLVLYSDGKNIHRGTFMTRLVKHGYIEPDVRWNPETRQQETMKTSWSKVSDFLM
ncbi:hypothetical protein FACS189428_0670 [Clostridia bacterium]|nr:hypothetical protein FACS189428_0670 [Clostridia bacterium]